MTSVDKQSPSPGLQSLVGTWRRFGIVGPVYEIMGIGHELANGDWLMRVRVLDTGEELGYKLSDLMDDPKEA